MLSQVRLAQNQVRRLCVQSIFCCSTELLTICGYIGKPVCRGGGLVLLSVSNTITFRRPLPHMHWDIKHCCILHGRLNLIMFPFP